MLPADVDAVPERFTVSRVLPQGSGVELISLVTSFHNGVSRASFVATADNNAVVWQTF